MRDLLQSFWRWFWQERTGVILFRRLRGARRLAVDVPINLLGIYALYLYLSSLPASGREFAKSIYWNPFWVFGIAGIFAYQLGFSYLRGQLPDSADFGSRVALLVPGTVLARYKKQFGSDLAVRVLRAITIFTGTALTIGILWANWGRISR